MNTPPRLLGLIQQSLELLAEIEAVLAKRGVYGAEHVLLEARAAALMAESHCVLAELRAAGVSDRTI